MCAQLAATLAQPLCYAEFLIEHALAAIRDSQQFNRFSAYNG